MMPFHRSFPGTLALATCLLVVGPALAGATVVLTDGQRIEGTDVRREGDVVFLTLASGQVMSLPAALVAETRLTQSAPPEQPPVAPTGIREGKSQILAGGEVEPNTPDKALAVFGPPAEFQKGPTSPDWVPEDAWAHRSADNWNPSEWAEAPTNPNWTPRSAFDGTTDVLAESRSTWQKAPTDPTWRPTDAFKKRETSFFGVPSGFSRFWSSPALASTAPSTLPVGWGVPPAADPAACAQGLSGGSQGLRFARLEKKPFDALHAPLYEMEFPIEGSPGTTRAVFTTSGGSCRVVSGDLDRVLGLPLSRETARSHAMTAFNLASSTRAPETLDTPADLVAYAFAVVTLASPEANGSSRAEIRLLATHEEFDRLLDARPADCGRSRRERRSARREAIEAFSEPVVKAGHEGRSVVFFTWLSIGGELARQEVFVAREGLVSAHAEILATHLGPHRDR